MKRLPIILFVLLLLPVAANAQNRLEVCATNRNAPPAGAYFWPPDSEVKVHLMRDMFTPEQRRTISEVMETWTRAAQATGAGVKFILAEESDGIVNCQGCLSIMRTQVHKFDRQHYAFFYPLNFNEDESIFSAWIDFDFAITDPHALKGFATHEFGHGLGLLDCPACKKKQTIMNGFPGVNRDNGLVAPSACDLEVVKQIYSTQRAEASQRSQAAASRRAKAGSQLQ
jgi:hypothetical protein